MALVLAGLPPAIIDHHPLPAPVVVAVVVLLISACYTWGRGCLSLCGCLRRCRRRQRARARWRWAIRQVLRDLRRSDLLRPRGPVSRVSSPPPRRVLRRLPSWGDVSVQ